MKRLFESIRSFTPTTVLLLVAIFALAVTPPAQAQGTLSISGAASSVTATGATIIGTVTGPILVGTATNAIDIAVLYGHTDAGTISANWANKLDLGNSFVGSNVFTNAFLNFPPGEIVFFRAQASDLSGSNVLQSASGIFTNTAPASTENVFREAVRLLLSSTPQPGLLTSNCAFMAGLNVTNTMCITNGLIRSAKTGFTP